LFRGLSVGVFETYRDVV